MRISYLSQSVLPTTAANAVHVMKMANAFSSLGHEVVLNVGNRSLRQLDSYILMERYGVETGRFQLRSHWFPRVGLFGRLLYALSSACSWLISGVDLYYARHPHALLFAAITSRKFALEMHAPPAGALEAAILKYLFRRSNFAGLVVISQPLRNIFLSQYPELASASILVAHDGADEYSGTTGELQPLRGRSAAFKCGYTGHLYNGRGIDIILGAAERLPDVDFHIVGGNPADVERWQSRNTCSNVFFYGHQEPRCIPGLLSTMDVLLAPYQQKVAVAGGSGDTVQWMSPLKIFEYMAAGKSIVCSDLPVLHEILSHEQTCLFVPPSDQHAWAAAIQRLRLDARLRVRLGEETLATFKASHTWTARAAEILRGLNVSEIH